MLLRAYYDSTEPYLSGIEHVILSILNTIVFSFDAKQRDFISMCVITIHEQRSGN